MVAGGTCFSLSGRAPWGRRWLSKAEGELRSPLEISLPRGTCFSQLGRRAELALSRLLRRPTNFSGSALAGVRPRSRRNFSGCATGLLGGGLKPSRASCARLDKLKHVLQRADAGVGDRQQGDAFLLVGIGTGDEAEARHGIAGVVGQVRDVRRNIEEVARVEPHVFP